MRKKKILIFIDWYLPGFKAGGPIQSVANLVSHLKDEFEISIVTTDTDYSDTTPYTTIQSDQWNTQDGIRVYYISKKQLRLATIRQLIKSEPTDCVYLNGIYSLYFTLFPLLILRNNSTRVVVAARGMLSAGSLHVKQTKKKIFLFLAKSFKLFDKITFHATTAIENKEIRAVFGINCAVKTAANLPAKDPISEWVPRKKEEEKLCLINVARIAPEKNLLLALKILQQVKTAVAFDFYGPIYNTHYWEACQEAMAGLPANVVATYKGSIAPDQVMQQLKKAHFLFMPTSGENFGHIILQALTAGCPVIISDQTPWKNLEHQKCGWDISLKDTEKFASLIDRLTQLQQPEYDQLSIAAYTYALAYISMPEVLIDNKALFN